MVFTASQQFDIIKSVPSTFHYLSQSIYNLHRSAEHQLARVVPSSRASLPQLGGPLPVSYENPQSAPNSNMGKHITLCPNSLTTLACIQPPGHPGPDQRRRLGARGRGLIRPATQRQYPLCLDPPWGLNHPLFAANSEMITPHRYRSGSPIMRVSAPTSQTFRSSAPVRSRKLSSVRRYSGGQGQSDDN